MGENNKSATVELDGARECSIVSNCNHKFSSKMCDGVCTIFVVDTFDNSFP